MKRNIIQYFLLTYYLLTYLLKSNPSNRVPETGLPGSKTGSYVKSLFVTLQLRGSAEVYPMTSQ